MAEDISFIEERITRINVDLRDIDNRLFNLKLEKSELEARQQVLKEARKELLKKRSQLRKIQSVDREMVLTSDLVPYLNAYLDGEPKPYVAMQALADRAGVSIAILEKIRYRGGARSRVEFNTADKILSAMGMGYVLTQDIEVQERWPLTGS